MLIVNKHEPTELRTLKSSPAVFDQLPPADHVKAVTSVAALDESKHIGERIDATAKNATSISDIPNSTEFQIKVLAKVDDLPNQAGKQKVAIRIVAELYPDGDFPEGASLLRDAVQPKRPDVFDLRGGRTNSWSIWLATLRDIKSSLREA